MSQEFWVKQHPTDKNISNSIDLYTATKSEPQNPGWIHVIEYSAYKDLKQELDERDKTIEFVENAFDQRTKKYYALKKKLETVENFIALADKDYNKTKESTSFMGGYFSAIKDLKESLKDETTNS